jgi:hypothetical protein
MINSKQKGAKNRYGEVAHFSKYYIPQEKQVCLF